MEELNNKLSKALELEAEEKYQESLEIFLDLLRHEAIDEKENFKILIYCLFRVAKIYKELKNYDEVVWYCQELIKVNYAFKEPYLLMAEIYNEMKMPTLAIACAKAAEEYGKIEETIDSDDCDSILNDTLSIAYSMIGELDKAIEYNEKVIEANEDNLQALKNQRALLKEKNKK